MQRKQRVEECWVCVILFSLVVVSTLHRAHRGFFSSRNVSHFWAVFWHMFFSDGFLLSVKELGLLTNTGHWVRVLDTTGSYMYIVNNV